MFSMQKSSPKIVLNNQILINSIAKLCRFCRYNTTFELNFWQNILTRRTKHSKQNFPRATQLVLPEGSPTKKKLRGKFHLVTDLRPCSKQYPPKKPLKV